MKRLDVKTEDGELLCPHCSNNFMHHTDVQVFQRREDAEQVALTTTHSGQTTVKLVDNYTSKNPSLRRHGVRLYCWCESCNESMYLAIAQHKGHSRITWEIDNGNNT